MPAALDDVHPARPILQMLRPQLSGRRDDAQDQRHADEWVDRSRKRKASHARDLGEMEKRVEAQFATLIANGIRHVVLSAFGCGAFENDPSEIAWVYKQAVERHRAAFAVIAFAIFYAGHGEDNYKIFKAFLELRKTDAPELCGVNVAAAYCGEVRFGCLMLRLF